MDRILTTFIEYDKIDSIAKKQERDMFCRFCGKELPENAEYCTACGKAVHGNAVPGNGQNGYYSQNGAPYANPDDYPNAGWAVLGFFFPLIGLILYLVWQRDYPNRAKMCGKGALICVIVDAALIILLCVFLVLIGFIAALSSTVAAAVAI